MQEQEVEVSFCDLCGESVPAADIAAQLAVLHSGKTIGSCCVAVLRVSLAAAAADATGEAAVAKSGGKADAVNSASPAGSGDGGRNLTLAIVMLVAFVGGVLFLDGRMSRFEESFRKAAEEASNRQQGDSDALQALSIKADGFAKRSEVGGVIAEVEGLAGALAAFRAVAADRQSLFDEEIGGLRNQLREGMSKIVDYRSLFEDLRQRQTRVIASIEGLGGLMDDQPVSAEPSPIDLPEVRKPTMDLPDALAENVRKLAAADPAVRFEAVDMLAESKDLRVLPYLLPLAKDPDAFVRRLTVEGLREFSKAEAVDTLIEALRDQDENVCDTAWRSLRDLTNQKLRFDASASLDARRRAAKAWQDWWSKARAGFGS